MIVYETEGSFWYLDGETRTYRRVPKQEGPRAPGPWVEPKPGDPLFDLEAHPYENHGIIGRPDDGDPVYVQTGGRVARLSDDGFPWLRIGVDEARHYVVFAPCARRVRP